MIVFSNFRSSPFFQLFHTKCAGRHWVPLVLSSRNFSSTSASRCTQVPNLDQFVYGKVDHDVVQNVKAELAKIQPIQWDDDGEMSRRTINFGWSFPSLEAGQKTFIDIPSGMRQLRKSVFDCLHPYTAPEDAKYYDNIIVTLYGPGQRIKPHWDRDESDTRSGKTTFSFGDKIIGAVLVSDTVEKSYDSTDSNSEKITRNPGSLCFWNYETTVNKDMKEICGPDFSMDPDERNLVTNSPPLFVVPEEPGTCFLFAGPLRYAPYLHGVPPVHTSRISVTMRRTHFND